jgi:hypothetical protein
MLQAAAVIEGQLGDSILEKDGRLAFSNLAQSTISTLIPKIETQGQLGKVCLVYTIKSMCKTLKP